MKNLMPKHDFFSFDFNKMIAHVNSKRAKIPKTASLAAGLQAPSIRYLGYYEFVS